MEGLQPFLDAVEGISTDGALAFVEIVGALAGIFVLEALDAMFEFFTGESSFTKFGTGIKEFADAIVAYSDTLEANPIDAAAVESSANAGKMLAELEAAIPNRGGKLAEWIGDNTLEDFAKGLGPFADAIVAYSDKLEANPIDVAAVESSANAGKMLADLEDTIPNTGGALANWIGDNKLDKFGERLGKFAEGITAYSDKLEANPIDVAAVESSANAGKMLAELEAAIPNTGGSLSTLLFGDNTLDYFGSRLETFADSLNLLSFGELL